MLKKRKIRLWLAFLAVAAAGLTVSFYLYYESIAKELEEDDTFGPHAANAIKHSYAAAQVYVFLDFIGIGEKTNETIVITLGYANEYLESIVRFYKPDSAGELTKDLHNNLSGVTAGRFYIHQASSKRMGLLEIIKILSQKQVLINHPDEVIILPFPLSKKEHHFSPIREAINAHKEEQGRIRKRVLETLGAH
jgi:hypothetical protein